LPVDLLLNHSTIVTPDGVFKAAIAVDEGKIIQFKHIIIWNIIEELKDFTLFIQHSTPPFTTKLFKDP